MNNTWNGYPGPEPDGTQFHRYPKVRALVSRLHADILKSLGKDD